MRCLVCGSPMEDMGGGNDRRDLVCMGEHSCLTVRVGLTETLYTFSHGGNRRLTVHATHLTGHIQAIICMRESVARRALESRTMLGISGNPFDPNYQPPQRPQRTTATNGRRSATTFLDSLASSYVVEDDSLLWGIQTTSEDDGEED